MGMFGPKMGSWWISSKEDPRWNDSGKGFCGGFTIPPAASEAVNRLKDLYGEPPKDLEYGYMKD